MKFLDALNISEYIKRGFDKYKYVLLICVVGLALALWPSQSGEDEAAGVPKEVDQTISGSLFDTSQMEKSLEDAFAAIDGVGRVRVILTVKSGYEAVYAYDDVQSASKSGESAASDSTSQMIIISSDGNEVPVTEKVNYPVFMGAVVVCDGGDNAKIKLQLTEAIRSLTGITADNIVISKMKN